MSDRMDFVAAIITIAKFNGGKDLFLRELIQSSIIDFANELQDDLRNQISHTATASESQQRSIVEKYQPVVEKMLAQLEFLSSFLLVRLPSFHFKKGKFIHRMEIYHGVIPQGQEYYEEDSLKLIHAEYNHIVLLDEDKQVLDLHPFYQLLANDHTHHEMHLCFFKQRKAAHKRLEGESVQGAFNIDLEGFDDLEVLLAKEPKGPQ